MNMKGNIKKFFKENTKNLGTDDEIVKGWLMNELEFNFSNAEIYHFLSAVAFFCIRKKRALVFDWEKIEKILNIKYTGAKE